MKRSRSDRLAGYNTLCCFDKNENHILYLNNNILKMLNDNFRNILHSILGNYSGYEISTENIFLSAKPKVICCVIDSSTEKYIHNYFVHNGKLKCFTSKSEYFDKCDFKKELIDEYISKYTFY